MSSTCRAMKSPLEEFSRRVDKTQEYYRSCQYNQACQNAYHAALAEIMPTGLTPCTTIVRQCPSIQVRQTPSQFPTIVAIYFLEFVVLKVGSLSTSYTLYLHTYIFY